MIDEHSVLYCKLKRYERKSKNKTEDGKRQIARRYMIPVKKDQIEGTNFEDIEDIVILSKDDFDYQLQKSKENISVLNKLKFALEDRNQKIIDFQGLLKEKEQELSKKNELMKKIKEPLLELNNAQKDYEDEINILKSKLEKFNEINSDYERLKSHNEELEREVKRLNDLRMLEKESFRIKLNEIKVEKNKYDRLNDEIELTKDEFNRLKTSHELLWDVVKEKDKIIKDLEKESLVGNIINKIRK